MVVESLQISTPSKISWQVMKLKSPYFWPRKSGHGWYSAGNKGGLKSLSFHFDCITKTWNIKLYPNPVGKTARTSYPSYKEGTAPSWSTFKTSGKITKFIACFPQQYNPVHHFTLPLHRKLTELWRDRTIIFSQSALGIQNLDASFKIQSHAGRLLFNPQPQNFGDPAKMKMMFSVSQ